MKWLGKGQLCLFLFLLGLAAVQSGCATTGEEQNLSERPWNTPKSWEHGLPPSLMEGR